MRYVLGIFGSAMYVLYDWYYRDFGITRSILGEIGRVLSYVF